MLVVLLVVVGLDWFLSVALPQNMLKTVRGKHDQWDGGNVMSWKRSWLSLKTESPNEPFSV